jgi:hypothetical protein
MNTEIIVKEFTGTIFEEIFQITLEEIAAAKKDLIDYLPVGANYKTLGPMSDFEKKTLALMIKKMKKLESLPEEMGIFDGISSEVINEAEVINNEINFLENMMFLMIQRRFGYQEAKLSINEDLQVITLDLEDEFDCSSCPKKLICGIFLSSN